MKVKCKLAIRSKKRSSQPIKTEFKNWKTSSESLRRKVSRSRVKQSKIRLSPNKSLNSPNFSSSKNRSRSKSRRKIMIGSSRVSEILNVNL